MEREKLFTSPRITIAAKELVKDSNETDQYVKAVNETVEEAVTAMEMRVKRQVEGGDDFA
jgi:hypothetical protein